MENNHYSIVIIGNGIAGLSAAIYAGRGGNPPLVLRGDEPGGQLTLTTDVENYPGFPDGIGGPELINNMAEQAEKFGAEIEHGIVDEIEDTKRPFEVSIGDESVSADSIIVASGASARTLDILGESDLMGYGVSTCATCDGAFFKGEEMAVIGGGDAAFEEANFLTKFASKVYLIHRREEFRAEQVWKDTISKKVETEEVELVLNSEVTEIHGSEEEGIDKINIVSHPDGHPTEKLDSTATEENTLDVGAVFIAIGHTPNTGFLDKTGVQVDDNGYVKVNGMIGPYSTATDVEGIFAAGDVVDHHYQQAATASGMGVKAALDADEFLEGSNNQ